MPSLKAGERIRETSSTAGAGTYTLDGAQTGFQPFSSLGASNLCKYFATDGTDWEVGIGTVPRPHPRASRARTCSPPPMPAPR